MFFFSYLIFVVEAPEITNICLTFSFMHSPVKIRTSSDVTEGDRVHDSTDLPVVR